MDAARGSVPPLVFRKGLDPLGEKSLVPGLLRLRTPAVLGGLIALFVGLAAVQEKLRFLFRYSLNRSLTLLRMTGSLISLQTESRKACST